MNDAIATAHSAIARPGSEEWDAMVTQARAQLAQHGMFNLVGFMRAQAVRDVLAHVQPRMARESFHHRRWHNIYFKDAVPGLAPTDPALLKVETSNHTLCHDQLRGTALDRLYRCADFATFLAAVMQRPKLYVMADALAGLNVMEYRTGEGLNWHFDRSIFTTTLLLQAPNRGGTFEYAQDLRRATNPNHAGVADLLAGRIAATQMHQDAGTLNVFLGVNTAHRVTPVHGARSRVIAVLSYFDAPGKAFSAQEQMGFYGRVA